jgi:hypothetical protein
MLVARALRPTDTEPAMNPTIRPLLTALALAAASLAMAAEAPPAKLLKEAKVSEAAARGTALAKVHGGTILSSELEREKGRLIWSFDISTPGTRNVTEIQVSAMSGKIVSTQVESASKEAAEAAAEKAEKK